MKETTDIAEEALKIPCDMLMDILSIIVKEELKHEVIRVVHNRSLVMVAIFYSQKDQKIQKVLSNIKNLIVDYWHYRSSENEELNWRDN